MIVSYDLEQVLGYVKDHLGDTVLFSVDKCDDFDWIDLTGSISNLSMDPLSTKYDG